MDDSSQSSSHKQKSTSGNLQFLQPAQIKIIDRALEQVGDYGEVRLVVERGKLRYIEVAHSLDVLKIQGAS